METAEPARGWPFLVARGRRKGFRVLLTPDPLVERGDQRRLEAAAGEVPDGAPWQRGSVRCADGRRLGLVWTEHRVRAADIGDIVDDAAGPRDEHSRPLRLIYGIACAGGDVVEPATGDMASALDEALATYRRFLRDEEVFVVERSSARPLASTITAGHRDHCDNPDEVWRSSKPPPPGPRRIVLAVLAAILAIFGVLLLVRACVSDPTDCPVPDDQVAATSTSEPAPC
jgi:hypothetical protein